MKTVGLVVVAAVGAVAVSAGIWALSFWIGVFGHHVQASYQARVVTNEIQQNVRTPDFAQSAYEQFFNDCNAVVAQNQMIAEAQTRIRALRAQPDDKFGQKAGRVADATTDLTGLEQARASTAARYNANAAEYTRGQFLDASLPPTITPPYTEVTCTGR